MQRPEPSNRRLVAKFNLVSSDSGATMLLQRSHAWGTVPRHDINISKRLVPVLFASVEDVDCILILFTTLVIGFAKHTVHFSSSLHS